MALDQVYAQGEAAMSFERVEIGDCVLYRGDCLEVLPTLESDSVQAVITDPPYSSGGQFRGDRNGSTSSKYLGSNNRPPKVEAEFTGDSRDSRGWHFWATLWMLRCHAVCSDAALAMLFTDWRQLPQCSDIFQAANWVWRGCAVWDKGNARPMSGRFSHQAEFILWGSKGAIGWDFDKPCGKGVLRHDAPKEFHQTEKPIELIEDMLKLTPADSTILDPFMGSGTTGVACVQTRRRFIGIELDSHYFDIACRRIEEAVGIGSLFDPTKAKEPELFD